MIARGLTVLPAFALVSLLASQADAVACSPAFSAGLVVTHDRPLIDLTVNGHQVVAIVDTAAEPNGLRGRQEINSLGMKPTGLSNPIEAPGGAHIRSQLYDADIAIGGTDLHRSAFLEDFGLDREAAMIQLGFAALKGYSIAINHVGGQFAGYDPKTCKDSEVVTSAATRFSLPLWHHLRMVTATVNGTMINGDIDTGAGMVLISRNAAHRAGITDEMLSQAPHAHGHVFGGRTVDDAMIDVPIELAGKNLGTWKVAVRDMPSDMVLGEPLLRKFNIYLPARSSDVYLTPQP